MCLAPAILYYSPEAAVDLSQILSFKKPKIYLILKKYHIISQKNKITLLDKLDSMSILYYPRPSQKTNLLFLFYFNSQISITCFGFRPVHMVSDVQLTTKNGITKTLAYKIHFCENFTFTFCQKRSSSVLAKLEKFKNAHPSGVSSSPCPLTCSPSPPSSS